MSFMLVKEESVEIMFICFLYVPRVIFSLHAVTFLHVLHLEVIEN